MNRQTAFCADRPGFIHGIPQHIHDAAESLLADRHGDGGTGIAHRQTALEAVAGAHGNAAHHTVTELLLHFKR